MAIPFLSHAADPSLTAGSVLVAGVGGVFSQVSGLTWLSSIFSVPGKIKGTPSSTTESFDCGSFGIQQFGVNSSWFGDNGYFDGTNWQRKNTGYICLAEFNNVGGFTLLTAPTAAAGSAGPGLTNVFTVSNLGVVTLINHLVSGGSTPTKTAGTGAGTGPTITVAGNDTAGTIAVTTGTAPAASATVVTVAFAVGYSASPVVVLLTPANAVTAALTGASQVYIGSIGTGSFSMSVGTTNLVASTAYKWYYTVIG
jgi:hypothetical protein